MEENFCTKWGLPKEELKTYELPTIATAHFVIVFVLLCLARPKFLQIRRHDMKTPEWSMLRTALVTAVVVGITYAYPYFMKTR